VAELVLVRSVQSATLFGLLLLTLFLDTHWAQGDDFHRWPTEKQVAVSSVIVRGEWKWERGINKCIIAEIIKQDPGTDFPFQVGDRFPLGDMPARADADYGDGSVMFLTGARASLRFTSGLRDGRLLGAGNIRLEKLRDVVLKERAKRKIKRPYYARYLEVAHQT
jgi:hypothetical protein